MADLTNVARLTGRQLALQVRLQEWPAGAPVALRQSVSTDRLDAARTEYVGHLVRRTAHRRRDGVTDPEEILAAYQVLHERGELLREELRA